MRTILLALMSLSVLSFYACGGSDTVPDTESGGTPSPTCKDGIQNGDETGVDCGGSICPDCGSGDVSTPDFVDNVTVPDGVVKYESGDVSTPDFVDNGDGTVTNNTDGLMWEVKTDINKDEVYDHAGAIAYCESLSLAGHDDWRLPERKELLSLIDLSKTERPAIDLSVFPNTQSSFYWSATTFAPVTANAWLVHFSSGNVGINDGKALTNYVRCSR